MRRIAPIVEGHGEESAVPVLFRRLAVEAFDAPAAVNVLAPIRVSRAKICSCSDDFIRLLRIANINAGDDGYVVILFDSDDDCPVEVADLVRTKSREVLGHDRVMCVVAHREFESWYIAAAESLSGVRGLGALAEPSAADLAVRGAKEWLSARMVGRKKYDPQIDQAPHTAKKSHDLPRDRRTSITKLLSDFHCAAF